MEIKKRKKKIYRKRSRGRGLTSKKIVTQKKQGNYIKMTEIQKIGPSDVNTRMQNGDLIESFMLKYILKGITIRVI